jgi:signal transduction histidine kinase
MIYNYFLFCLLAGGVVSLISGFIPFFYNKKKAVNKVWLLLNLASSVWSFGYYSMVTATDKDVAWISNWVLHFAAIFVPVLLIHFVIALTHTYKKYKLILLSSYFTSIFFVILNPTKYFISDLKPKYIFNYVCDAGPLYSLFALYFFSWAIISLLLLYKEIRNSTGVANRQYKYIFTSSTFGFLGGGSVFFLTFNVDIPPYPLILFSLFPVVITYAMIRYRFLDIRLIIARTIAFGLIVLLITSIYTSLSALIALFFESLIGGKSNIIGGVLVSILVTLGYSPIRKIIESLTEKFLFKKSYNPDILLARIAEVTSSIINIQTLLEAITNSLNDAFRFQKSAIVLLDKDNKLAVAYKQGFDPEVAEKLASYPDILNILSKEIVQTPGIMVLDEMKTRYENGEFNPISPELLTALTENDLAIVAPLYVNQQLIGVMVLGNKKSGDSYNQQDVRALKIIAGQVAVAIENAKLYDELKNFSVTLEEEVQKKTAELQRANDELRQLDTAKSEFISIASHQLRTPLTVIKGYISMTREGSFGKVPPKIMDNLEKVYASNERLIGLVENLLDISRIESGRQEYVWKETHLEDLAQTVVDNLKHNAKIRDLKLIFHKPKKKTPLVVIDANKIHEVMMNFVDNAIKYTEKGKIDVTIEPHPKGMVTFCVKDTGRGISEESRNLLFKKFSRGKGSFQVHTEGVGLGLYVAKMLIDAHGGKIWADSEGMNKGSTFCFSIPLGNKSKITPIIAAEK